MKKLLILVGLTTGLSVLGAELSVDRTGADGAYTSINAAIQAANSYDTIWVRPGVYDNDPGANTESSYPDVPAVVYVTKPLYIIATSSNPADTHIVGRFDPDTVGDNAKKGAGPNAIRCIRFAGAAALADKPAVLKGFTIRNGACYTKETTYDDDGGQPGGVAGRTGINANFYVSDCVISNCVGVRGGLVRYGNYVRCRFSDGIGLAGQSLGRNIGLLNCLATHLMGVGVVMDGLAIVNTTFADMDGVPYRQDAASVGLYNCVLASCMPNSSQEATKGIAYNSLLPYPQMALTKEDCKNQVDDDIPYPFIAPLRGDFRLRTGTEACGIGRAEHIATYFSNAPEIVAPYVDMGGKTIPQTGAINPGCYQEAVEPATGVMQFGTHADPQFVNCDGYENQYRWLYASGIEPHEMFRVSATNGASPAFMFEIGGFLRFPDIDDSLLCMCPPVGTCATNKMRRTTMEYWVNPETGVDGDESEGYGTEAKPFKTLQHPCNLAIAGNRYTLVHAAAGVYAEGGRSHVADPSDASNWHTNRVYIFGQRHVRIKGAGRGRSFIVGRADTTSEGAVNGMGPAAVRCVHIEDSATGSYTYGCVQGFTIQDGYADKGTAGTYNRRVSGGLFCGGAVGDRHHVLADCELVGGVAFRGGIAYGGSLVRCIVRNHETPAGVYGGALYDSTVENSLFYGNNWGNNNGNGPNTGTLFFGCTLTSDLGSPVNHGSSSLKLNSCLVLATGSVSGIASLANVINSVMWGYTSVSGSDTLLLANQKFVDPSAPVRDYRLRIDSPVITAGFPALADEWRMVHTDVNGDPCRHVGGMLLPGAVHDAAEVVKVIAPPTGSFDVSGETVLDVGETFTVNLDATGATRLPLGITVDGELQEGTSSYSYTSVSPFAADGSFKAPVVVSALFSTNWYVNANTGSDGNDGFTPETPWRTLAKLQAMTNVFWTGDVVHAAAGDYNVGTVETAVRNSFISGYGQLPSRVEVPSGVTLVADEGPTVTFITGEFGSGNKGMGSGAVRCAAVADNARLEGFTLRGGGTFNNENAGDQFCGGGAFGRTVEQSADCGVVYGCVITNCVAQRGGAVRGLRAVNCTILGCGATACSAAGNGSWFLGCYINDCQYNAQLMRNSYFVGNCTFGPTQFNNGGSAVSEVNPNYGGVVNCVFLNKLAALRKNAANHYRGCKFLKMDITDSEQRASLGNGCEEFTSAAAFGLDSETGRPLSKAAGTVCSSDDSLPEGAESFFCGMDVDGGQRIYNGQMDSGCYEYDWRSEYSRALGASVSVADPQVVEAAGGVLVKNGKLVYDFPLNGSGRNATYTVPFSVTGMGVLSVLCNDISLGDYTSVAGAQVLSFKNAEVENRMTFAYACDATDDSGALLSAVEVKSPPGCMLIVY